MVKMNKKRQVFLIIITLLMAGSLAAVTARAQFWDKLKNPKFSVPITHPPRLVLKNVTTIASRNSAANMALS